MRPTARNLLPLIYAYYNKTIVFWTVPDAVMSQLARRTIVAPEIAESSSRPAPAGA